MSEKLRGISRLDAADCYASLARDSAKTTDEILSAEITAMVGDGWMIADLQGRLQSVRVRSEPQETILLDGKPLVASGPRNWKPSTKAEKSRSRPRADTGHSVCRTTHYPAVLDNCYRHAP